MPESLCAPSRQSVLSSEASDPRDMSALARLDPEELIDTAVDYGTQPGIGAAIRGSGLGRDEIFLVTKVEENEDACQGTVRNLRELGLDHANLVLIHRPPANGAGLELWQGLIKARNAGLTGDMGVSNYSIGQIETLVDATGEVPVVNQIE
jgi:diketogulonate reductase-like aldo/keto reductase